MAVNLYVRSVYTLLSSMCSIEDTIYLCKEYGYKSLAIVDKNVLQGAMNFKKAALKNGIKPIFGLEVDVEINDNAYPVILYAKDDEGYEGLMGLSSYICTNQLEKISLDVLNEYRKHNFLVLLSDSMPLTSAIDKNENIDETLKQMKEDFGDFLVGLVDHNISANLNRDKKIKTVLKRNEIKTLAVTYFLST